MVQIPESFDLVLELKSESNRESFLQWIENYFINLDNTTTSVEVAAGCDEKKSVEDSSIPFSIDSSSTHAQTSGKIKIKFISASFSEILKDAETKDRRREKLDRFFREAYALTFGLK